MNKRDDLKKSNVHNRGLAGIAGNTKEGAYSIVLSNGYEDDVDEGDFMYVRSYSLCDCTNIMFSSYTGTGESASHTQ